MKNKRTYYLSLVLLGIGIVAVLIDHARLAPPAPGTAGKMSVAASFYPLYFFTSQVGGDKVAVYDITPAGAEPHDYEPTPQDMAHIEGSALAVLSGNGLEAWGQDVLKSIDPARTIVVEAGESLATRQADQNGKMIVDPHVWLDPSLAKAMADKIERGLAAADPKDTAYFESNKEALDAQLDALGTTYKQGLAACARRDIITSHAAFGYLAAAYGLTQVSISGLSPDAEPSSEQLATIAQFAREHQVTTIFFESLVSPRLARTIATEVGAQTAVLDPIEGISEERLAHGENYFSVMRDNLAHLEAALQCKA